MGAEDATTGRSSGLKAFEAIEDISIVAAPGSTLRDDARSNTIIGALISHAERMQYRIAVVDCARQQTIANVRALRARYDSSHAAFYYPWVRILDPATGVENYYPPTYSTYAAPSAYYGGWYGYYSMGYSYQSSPGYVEQNQVYRVETNLYNMTTDKLTWSGLTESTLSSGQAPTGEITPVIAMIANDMQKKKVLPPRTKS